MELFAGTFPENNTLFTGTVLGRCSSQHLRTLKKVPANKVLFAGTVPANNLFEY